MTLRPYRIALLCLLALPALAQRGPAATNPPPARPATMPPPGAPPAKPPMPMMTPPQGAPQQPAQQRAVPPSPPPPGTRAIAPTAPVSPESGSRQKPTCDEVRRKAKYGIYFDKVDIDKLVQTVADATCKTFILPENVRGKISIIGPENGKTEVDADQFYAAFLAALDSNSLALTPSGKFLKIIEKRSAKQSTIPTLTDENEPYTTNEQMITRIFKVKNVEIEPLRGVLSQLVTKDGDCIPYAPDVLICNDLGSNMHRLEKIVDQLDTRASTDEIRIIQVQYASAQDVANTIQKVFEQKGGRLGQRTGTAVMGAPPQPGQPPVGAPPPAAAGAEGTGGPVTLSQIIPDERTNKLVIVASPAAFDRILRLIREIDIPISGEGRINVYYLENANAEDIASTLQTLAQGTANRPRTPTGPAGMPGAPPGMVQGARGGGGGAAELFAGEVKVSADKGTNSLVIIASQSDYRNLVRVIEKLDIPRRQVFVEAVIMEVNLDRDTEFGLSFHQGLAIPSPDGPLPALVGTNYNRSGLPPSFSLTNLASMGGFLAGLQGPILPELARLGVNIPAFGVVLHALQKSSDVNVLSTPHLLTSDNEEAEITVGQNVPFQAGFNPSGMSSLLGQATGGVNPALFGGGLSSLYAPINRQNVELKLTVKPQINESDLIRMVISEQTEEIASTDPVLGPTTSKRSAKTTVVARNQETVVIGGIMQDRTIESVNKIPILGDIPLVGHLFRDSTKRKVKTNLLLFLTPYIINDASDFRAIFERKMAERQQFVEQFYGQVPEFQGAVDLARKSGPFTKINRTIVREQQKAEFGGPGAPSEQVITPAPPSPVPPAAPQASPPPAPPSGAPAQQPAPPPADDTEQLKVKPPPEDYSPQQ